MKIIPIQDLKSSFNLQKHVFIHPTNSSYGIWASIYNKEWYHRIYALKKRDISKPFFITVLDLDKIHDFACFDERIYEYIKKYPETIFTFILRKSSKLPSYINNDIETVWIQIAKGVLYDICKSAWWAMFWTSANISGDTPIYNSSQIESVFSQFPDILFIDAWNLKPSQPSVIIDLTSKEEKILRGSLN